MSEVGRQGAHVFDGKHDLGGLLGVVGLYDGTRELELRIALQRANKDQFGRATAYAVTALNAPRALGLTQTDPVGRAVDGARKTCRIDEGLKQQQGLLEVRQPVAGDTLLTKRQDFGAQVGQMPLWQDQKPAVVSDEFESPVLVAVVPPDPAVTRGALQSRGGKTQRRGPLPINEGNVPQRVADLGQVAQVVVLLH